jgi:hypothetical protein
MGNAMEGFTRSLRNGIQQRPHKAKRSEAHAVIDAGVEVLVGSSNEVFQLRAIALRCQPLDEILRRITKGPLDRFGD